MSGRVLGWLVGTVAILGLVAGLAGCGSGQIAQTAQMVSTADGSSGSAGPISVLNAQIAWSGPVRGDAVYQPGQDAELQTTIANSGDTADRLTAVTSPVARQVRITGRTLLAPDESLVAGSPSALLPGAAGIRITLSELTEPVRAGLTYPVTFTFEQAGAVHLVLGVQNPPTPPERS
ncbi:copper chaperone PCu(A)C [Pseudonocardia hispaniensis]|uniref:Copper chaperone PCu(A)C n=1 Tax=Pseudonocardia hispaniensis TaxID=904933 RepID=A0ABW1J4T7_9PSEU